MTSRSPFQRFMAELRRRHVPQTAAVYMVAAWAAIEFADVVVPNLGWTQSVVTAVIIAAAVGLPVVVALAWFLEWTSEGLHRTPPAPAPDESEAGSGRGQPVEPTGSYTPWAVALGVLSLGIAGALVFVALDSGDESAAVGQEEARTRSERRQSIRDSMPVAPIPPSITRPGFADSLARSTSDSVMEALGSEGFDPAELGPLVEMARRIGEAAGRTAMDGPVEVTEPETWRYGAPQPVRPGDTLTIRGVARGEGGVLSVEVDGRVVARAGSRQGAVELPFSTTLVAGEGSGFRRVPVVVRYAEGEPLRRDFSITLVARPPDG